MKADVVTRDEFKTEIQDITARMDKMETQLSSGPDAAMDTETSGNQVLMKRLEQIEAELKAKPTDTSAKDLTVVIGGLTAADTIDDAGKWLSGQLYWNHGPKHTEYYCKGDWKGLLFIKFATKSDRDAAVIMIRTSKWKYGSNEVWAKADLPIETRVQQGVLFAIKKYMVSWGYAQKAVWVDTEKLILQIGTDIVIQVRIIDKNLDVQIQPGWELNGEEIAKIIDDAKQKLMKGMTPTKGLGKGKEKGKATGSIH